MAAGRFTAATAAAAAAIAVANAGIRQTHLRRLALAVAPVKDISSRKNVIYLDFQATTPTDPRVLEAMLPYFTEAYGNPHSRTHAYGWEAEQAVEAARAHVAHLIGAADPREIIFTSGATESNNLAIKGVARFYRKASGKSHIVTVQTEHKCILDSCRALQAEGFDVTYLPVDGEGRVRLADVERSLRPETIMLSAMAVNNEIGSAHGIPEIGALCRERRVLLHTDAAQAVGKVPLDVEAARIDLLSLSGHKIYGPKGIGALYVRRRPRVRLEPLFSGGGQERGLRSGTLPTPLVVGLGEAARLAAAERASDSARIGALADRLVAGIMGPGKLTYVVRNGGSSGYAGCVNLSFSCVEGESLLMALKGFALSSGSACTSASLEPSYVLRALASGRAGKTGGGGDAQDDAMAHSSIRFGIGRYTTEAQIDAVIASVVEAVTRLRELSPLWEMMVEEGIDLSTINWTSPTPTSSTS